MSCYSMYAGILGYLFHFNDFKEYILQYIGIIQ